VRRHAAAVAVRDLNPAYNLTAILGIPTTTTRHEPHAIEVRAGRRLPRCPRFTLRSRWTGWPDLTWRALWPTKQVKLTCSDVGSTDAAARRKCPHGEQSS
jgi:hypothetical protein